MVCNVHFREPWILKIYEFATQFFCQYSFYLSPKLKYKIEKKKEKMKQIQSNQTIVRKMCVQKIINDKYIISLALTLNIKCPP